MTVSRSDSGPMNLARLNRPTSFIIFLLFHHSAIRCYSHVLVKADRPNRNDLDPERFGFSDSLSLLQKLRMPPELSSFRAINSYRLTSPKPHFLFAFRTNFIDLSIFSFVIPVNVRPAFRFSLKQIVGCAEAFILCNF